MKNSKLSRSQSGRMGGLIGREVMIQKRISNIEKYRLSPIKCKTCHEEIEYDKRINVFCSRSCSARFNVKLKERPNCLICGTPVGEIGLKYCSQKCVGISLHNRVVLSWKNGEISGISKNGTVITPIRKYIFEKYNSKCCLCGWSKINPYTKKIPLVVDHIDGNYLNNNEGNLRAICWNCDALGNTFGALNKGNGRKMRYVDGIRQF